MGNGEPATCYDGSSCRLTRTCPPVPYSTGGLGDPLTPAGRCMSLLGVGGIDNICGGEYAACAFPNRLYEGQPINDQYDQLCLSSAFPPLRQIVHASATDREVTLPRRLLQPRKRTGPVPQLCHGGGRRLYV